MAVRGEARLNVANGVVGNPQGDEKLTAGLFFAAALLGDAVPCEEAADGGGEKHRGGDALPEKAVGSGCALAAAKEQALLEAGR